MRNRIPSNRSIRHGSVSFEAVTRGCILLGILNISTRSIQNSSSSLETREGWKKRFDQEKEKKKRIHFLRFIISLNLIRIKGKKRKKILKNTFDHFNRNSNTGDKDAHHLNERMERKKEGEGEEE